MVRSGTIGDEKVLRAARALEDVIARRDTAELGPAIHDLVRVGEARESGMGSTQGFRSAGAPETSTPDVDEELGRVATELGIGQTLIAAGAAVETPADREPGPLAELSTALDDLEREIHPREQGVSATSAFRRANAPEAPIVTVESVRRNMTSFFGDVVLRTESVGKVAVSGLLVLPPGVASLADHLSDVPGVGALTSLGLRAVQRAVEALRRLVPVSVREQIQQLAGTWWDEKGAPGVCRRLLAVGPTERDAIAILDRLTNGPALSTAQTSLDELSDHHAASTRVVDRVVRALRALVAPALALFPAVAPWIYAAAAIGYLAAMAAALWIGRDALDAGSWADGVDGVRVILARIAP